MSRRLSAWFCLSLLGACGGDDPSERAQPATPDTPNAPGTPDEGSTQQPVRCEGNASYTVSFEATWSATSHPDGFPANPHFSGLIGAAHAANHEVWAEGGTASPGIEQMAETGAKTLLTEELEAAIAQGRDLEVLSGGGIALSPGSATLDITLTPTRDRVSLVSMIAPSPDWFVGVHGISLCEAGQWMNRVSVDLLAYDAGTDSGLTYTAANNDTTPREFIGLLEAPPFLVNNELPPLGRFVFSRQ